MLRPHRQAAAVAAAAVGMQPFWPGAGAAEAVVAVVAPPFEPYERTRATFPKHHEHTR